MAAGAISEVRKLPGRFRGRNANTRGNLSAQNFVQDRRHAVGGLADRDHARIRGDLAQRRNRGLVAVARVVRVDAERNLLFVLGAVPGPMSGIVAIRRQGGRSRYA